MRNHFDVGRHHREPLEEHTLSKQLTKQLVQQCLESEMDKHLVLEKKLEDILNNIRNNLRVALAIVLFGTAFIVSSAKAEETFFEKGKELAKQGKHVLAIPMFDDWIISHPSDTDAYYQRSRSYLDLGKYQKALEDCNKVVSLNPNSIDAHFFRGLALHKLGLEQRAIEDFGECIKIDPGMVNAYFNRSVCLHDTGKYEEAFADVNRAIALQPDYITALMQRAHINLEHLGKRQDAIDDYKHILALKPNEKSALEGLAQATGAADAAPVWTAHQVESTTDRVIVYVFADWCGPCKRMRPVFNEVVNEIRFQKFVLMNLDDKNNEAFLSKHNIGAVPTFLLISNGKILRTSVGAVPKAILEDFVYGRNDYDPFRSPNTDTGHFGAQPKANRRKGNRNSKGRRSAASSEATLNKLKMQNSLPPKQPPKPIRLP